MKLSYLTLLSLSLLVAERAVHAQEPWMSPTGANLTTGIFSNNTNQPINDMNPTTMAQARSPLLVGPNCKYNWYMEFNVLHTMCFDTNGLPANAQLRVVQAPIQQCSVRNNDFIMALNIENIARFFVRPTDGTYFCCDVYEPGYGYLFTDCGGQEVVVLGDKFLGDLSIRSMPKVMGYTNPLWNYTQLQDLVNAHCNNTYKVGDEYMMGGQYQFWLTLDLPWQQWMQQTNIQNLEQLRVWIVRYYAFLTTLLEQLAATGQNNTEQFNATQAVVQSVDVNVANLTAEQLLANYTSFFNNFSQWISQVRSQIVQSQPGLAQIPPGYRAIVRWVRQHIIQELHARIFVAQNDLLQQPVSQEQLQLNTGAGGIGGGEFGDQTYNGARDQSPALTGGGSNQNSFPTGSGV